MKYGKIVLAGGNGYLGRILTEHYRRIATEIVILTRKNFSATGKEKVCLWDGKNEGDWAQILENTDLLINLFGKNVNCRYTRPNREAIINSRILPTRLLARSVT